MESTFHPQICRICHNTCAVVVEAQAGRAIRVRGDSDNPMFAGYICPKGRALPQMHNDPARLLRPQRRSSNGEVQTITVDEAVTEIAARLQDIIATHGPRSVVGYAASGVQAQVVMATALGSFLTAIGSPWPMLGPESIDQAGKARAAALHGSWMAPPQRFDAPDVAMLVGTNPLVSHQGFPQTSPLAWLRERKAAGMKLIVIDPRRSETARHADIHLQVRPGEDAAVLAGMLNVILSDGVHDRAFVAAHTDGLETLRGVVAAFTPQVAARRAGIDPQALVAAARTFALAGRGYAAAGTAPNMSGRATLVEYLVLCLDTVCGHWLREGDVVRYAPALVREQAYKAQAQSPRIPSTPGPALRVPGRPAMPGGLQLADIVDEMLLDGDGRIRALVCLGGNPVVAWPDQQRTTQALRSLELLVVADPFMTATAKLAHYVIPPKMLLEVPAVTMMPDLCSTLGPLGYVQTYAQYAPAAVPTPEGADLIEEWDLLRRIASAMGFTMRLRGVELGGTAQISTDDILIAVTRSARIPLEEVKRHPHGAVFADDTIRVGAPDGASNGRLELASAPMMEELAELTGHPSATDDRRPFRLIARRMAHVQNSLLHGVVPGRPSHNPAYMNPFDMADLDVSAGDLIEIESRRALVVGVVAADEGLRRGVVSMAHSFGDLEERDLMSPSPGACTGRLIDVEIGYDHWSGQPRMSNVPVSVRRARTVVERPVGAVGSTS